MMSPVDRVMYRTIDPTVTLDRSSAGKEPGAVPALTSLLHKVCDNDKTKFEEACRIVELFIAEALKGDPVS